MDEETVVCKKVFHIILSEYLQIQPPMVANILVLWVWEVYRRIWHDKEERVSLLVDRFMKVFKFELFFLVFKIKILFLFQPKAMEKADDLVTLLGYPDWLPDHIELDNYFAGVSKI